MPLRHHYVVSVRSVTCVARWNRASKRAEDTVNIEEEQRAQGEKYPIPGRSPIGRSGAAGAMLPVMDFGDRVRIAAAPATEASGFASRAGIVYGWTTPSVTGVDVVGDADDDFAYNVAFEEPIEDAWFAPQLVELIDHAPGTEAVVGDQHFIRDAEGEWHQVSSHRRKWPFSRRRR
jgi:hypothetical protein